MRKIVLTYGFISGAIMSAMMLATMPFIDQIGFERGMIVGYTSMVMAFLMIYFGVRSYRDNMLGGQVGFGRAFATGLLIALIASVCYVATWQMIKDKVAPDFANKYAAHEVESLRSAGATEAQVAAKVAEMEEFKVMYAKPVYSIGMTFLEPLPVGLLFALISAGVHSRKRRPQGALAT